MQDRHQYHETRFFLVAIAFISAFNYYLTYNNIHFNRFLALTYSLDTIEGWLAWWAMRSIILYLDEKLPYTRQPLKRILIQVLLTTIAGLLVIILLTELASRIIKGVPAVPGFYLYDILLSLSGFW